MVKNSKLNLLLPLSIILFSFSALALPIVSNAKEPEPEWVITKTGNEELLDISIKEHDASHVNICIQKPPKEYLDKVSADKYDAKQLPITVVSPLTKSMEITSSKNNLDVTAAAVSNEYCFNVEFTKIPIDTTIKIGWNTANVTYTFNTIMDATAMNFIEYSNGTLTYAYLDTGNDVAIAYSHDNGVTWSSRVLKSTTGTRVLNIMDSNTSSVNKSIFYVYNDAYDDVRYISADPLTSSAPAETADWLWESGSAGLAGASCGLDNTGNRVHCSSFSTNSYDVQFRLENDTGTTEIDTDGSYQTSFFSNYSSSSYNYVVAYRDRTSGAVEVEYGSSLPNSGSISTNTTGYACQGYYVGENLFFPTALWDGSAVYVVNSTIPSTWHSSMVINSTEVGALLGINGAFDLPRVITTKSGLVYLVVHDSANDVILYKYKLYNAVNWSSLYYLNATVSYGYEMAYDTEPLEANDRIHLILRNTSSSYLYYDYIDIVDITLPEITLSTPSDINTTLTARNWTLINITSNEALNSCLLEWNTSSNITMSNPSSTSYYHNKTENVNGNYSYKVFCNDTSNNIGISGQAWVTFNITPPEENISYHAFDTELTSFDMSSWTMHSNLEVFTGTEFYTLIFVPPGETTTAGGAHTKEYYDIIVNTEHSMYLKGEFIKVDITIINNGDIPDKDTVLLYYLTDKAGNVYKETREQIYEVDSGKTVLKRSLQLPQEAELGEWMFTVEYYTKIQAKILAYKTFEVVNRKPLLSNSSILGLLLISAAIIAIFKYKKNLSEEEEEYDEE